MNTFSFDYETFYSKEYSIRDLGNYAYTHHPEFDAYMLAVACEDGTWVGNPKEFDWELFKGATVIAHNAGFERAVTDRLIELGLIPAIEFGQLVDTADLAAYLGYPRALADAAYHLLGVKPDKTMRDKAKGKRWNDMTPEFQGQMSAYAVTDAVLELRLWVEHNHKWPEWEQTISKSTRAMCARGLPVDLTKVAAGIAHLQTQLHATRNKIPWSTKPGAALLSKKELGIECTKIDIAPPKSMAKDSQEFEDWLKQHGDSVPFAKAMGEYRSINMLLKKLETITIRTRPDSVMPYALKYGGAHTMRDSGDAGFNPQNLPREDLYGIDMRGMLVAPEGYTFGVVDLKAIEPCCLAVLSGDEEFVGLLRQGYDPYEAQARVTKRYEAPEPLKEADPALRQFMKVEVLGLGYGAGADKLIIIAKKYGLTLELRQSAAIVQRFREREFIPKLWGTLEKSMFDSTGKDFSIILPSGRVMHYRDVINNRGLSALIPRGHSLMRQRCWGGTLAENLTQGAARDVFMDRALEVENQGFDIRLRVHDELVTLFPEETAEADLSAVIQIMSIPPLWWPELPVSAEGHLCKSYKKL